MKRKYLMAIWGGAAFGVFLLVSHSILGEGAWTIPTWDSFRNFEPGPRLDLAHQALLLRFCKTFLESGFQYLSIPAVVALLMLKIDEYGNRNSFVQAMSWSFQLLAVFLGAIILVVCLVGTFGSLRSSSIEESLLFGLTTLNLSLLIAPVLAFVPWAILTLVVWVGEKSYQSDLAKTGGNR